MYLKKIAIMTLLHTETLHCESKKLGHFFKAYNFRNIEQIFTKFGTIGNGVWGIKCSRDR